MDDLARKLNISDQEDWYKVTLKQIHDHGGQRMLSKYDHSIKKLLSVVYSEYLSFYAAIVLLFHWYKWDSTKFNCAHRLPLGYWNVIDNQRAFLDDIAKKLNITQHEDWYRISRRVLQQHGGASLLSKYKNVHRLLCIVYPEYRPI